jgi:2-polyprenyl-3-methyl-5-hydroxy-6-metoxy-1,4-benzoquinol methylase
MSEAVRSSAFNAYRKAVTGSERARHTYHRRLNAIRDFAGDFANKTILDLGCGFGFRTVGIAASGADFILGIDMDDDRIREANGFARSKSVDNVDFVHMDAEGLAFPDETFDVVVADEMIHHLENLPQVMQEMHRVLKYDGIVIISDHNRLSLPSEIMRSVYFGKNKERVFTAKEVKRYLAQTGFKDIVYRHIIFTIPLAKTPRFILRINYLLESFIEHTPLLRSQCGVYLVKGIKRRSN